MREIRLYKDGYEPFIDFFKGLAILFVVFSHCTTPLVRNWSGFYFWAAAPTAFFMIIHVFHLFRKGTDVKKPNFGKLIKRVFFPFLIVQLILIIGYVIKQGGFSGIETHLMKGGIGQGAYFPWVYFEFVVFCWLISPVFRKIKNIYLLGLFFILLAEAVEVLCCLTDISISLYRVLFFRYIFLVYLGYVLVVKGLQFNIIRLGLALVGLVGVIIFNYSNLNLEPWFYNRTWYPYHWVCYFYYAFALIPIYYYLFKIIERKIGVVSFFKKCGEYSYEIFLFQMIWFSLPIKQLLNKVIDGTLLDVLYIVLSMLACIIPVVAYKEIRKRHLNTSK